MKPQGINRDLVEKSTGKILKTQPTKSDIRDIAKNITTLGRKPGDKNPILLLTIKSVTDDEKTITLSDDSKWKRI